MQTPVILRHVTLCVIRSCQKEDQVKCADTYQTNHIQALPFSKYTLSRTRWHFRPRIPALIKSSIVGSSTLSFFFGASLPLSQYLACSSSIVIGWISGTTTSVKSTLLLASHASESSDWLPHKSSISISTAVCVGIKLLSTAIRCRFTGVGAVFCFKAFHFVRASALVFFHSSFFLCSSSKCSFSTRNTAVAPQAQSRPALPNLCHSAEREHVAFHCTTNCTSGTSIPYIESRISN